MFWTKIVLDPNFFRSKHFFGPKFSLDLTFFWEIVTYLPHKIRISGSRKNIFDFWPLNTHHQRELVLVKNNYFKGPRVHSYFSEPISLIKTISDWLSGVSEYEWYYCLVVAKTMLRYLICQVAMMHLGIGLQIYFWHEQRSCSSFRFIELTRKDVNESLSSPIYSFFHFFSFHFLLCSMVHVQVHSLS